MGKMTNFNHSEPIDVLQEVEIKESDNNIPKPKESKS